MRYAVMYIYEADDENTARAAADDAWDAIEGAGGAAWSAVARRLHDERYSERITDWDGWQDDAEGDFRVLQSED